MEYRLEILGATAKMMKFGLFLGAQHLGKMQYYFHVKFSENLRWLSVSNSTLNV